jgi:hypothetical protein
MKENLRSQQNRIGKKEKKRWCADMVIDPNSVIHKVYIYSIKYLLC